MKKFSTAGILLAASLLAPLAMAAEPGLNAPGARSCTFLANAPDQHKVVRGDTLWDISGRFLQHPWCWPQVWDLNRDQIRDPHWIYPGQIVYFDRAAGRLRIGQGADSLAQVRLSPQTRVTSLTQDAIPSIPIRVIEPFLSQPLIVEEDTLATSPYIVATHENQLYLGKGDKAYVVGELQGNTQFQVFRPSRPLHDPITNAVIGHEAIYLGTVKLDQPGRHPEEAHRFIIDSSKQEIGRGDRLVPMPPPASMHYAPHPPDAPVAAHIVSVYGGVGSAAQNEIVSINRGRLSGLDVGTVLELNRAGRIVADATGKPVQLPPEKLGTLFVFRVFDNISYGLVMQVTDVVEIGDIARSPE